MKTRIIISISLIVTVSLAVLTLLPRSADDQPLEPAVYNQSKQLRYSFEVRNTGSDFIKQSKFSAFAPVAQTSSQKVIGIEASLPFEMETDKHGNQLMHFSLEGLPPFGTKVIVITVEMAMSAKPNQLSVEVDRYNGDHDFLQINHPDIVATSTRLHELGDEDSKAVFDWVSSHVSYSGFDPEDRGALFALEEARGDCTEYSYLSAALLRAQGTPTRVLGGFVLAGDTNVLRASAYHNWAEVLEDHRWKISDAQKGAFDEQYENYIAFRVIEPGAKSMSNSHRFLAFDPRLEVMMN